MQDTIHPKYNRKYIQKSISMGLDDLQKTLKGENKIIDLKLPEEMKKQINFDVDEKPCEEQELNQQILKILQHQSKPHHPHFHNQLFGGFDQYSVVGGMLAQMINGSVYTYEISSCWTLMQLSFFEHIRKIVGWDHIDGMFTPGGSFANFMGITLSRFKLNPDIKKKGMFGLKPLKIFTSQQSHYSVFKGVHLCGIGIDNILMIPTDTNNRMKPQELQNAIKKQLAQNNTPLMVNLTIGTTVQGAIDPIQQCAAICKKYNVWCHVDAALGGSFMMSSTLKQKITGLKEVDSFIFDLHKGLTVPLQASFFATKHQNLLKPCNQTTADYLFHKQRASYDGSLDVGQKSLQCGRCIDIFKIWVYLKGNGWDQIGKEVDRKHKLALYLQQYIVSHPKQWKLVYEQVHTFNVCYWYIPQGLKKQDYANQEEYYSMLSKITVLAKKYMIEEGKILLGYSKSKVKYYFWRCVMLNSNIIEKDVLFQIELIQKYCEISYGEIMKENNFTK